MANAGDLYARELAAVKLAPTLRDLRATLRDLRGRCRDIARERHRVAWAVSRADAREPRRERPRCGARTRSGAPCKAPCVWPRGALEPRKRCRLHGGLSTGPRTVEGLARSLANLRNVDVEAASSLREARGVQGFGASGCPFCDARQTANRRAIDRAFREGLPLAPSATLCAEHTAALVKARERGRLRFSVTRGGRP